MNNMQNLMEQAKKLQSEMEKLSTQIEQTVYTAEKNGFRVEIKGTTEMVKVSIENPDILKDKELAEDMILLVCNEALTKLKKDKEEKLGKYTSGVGGLF